MSNHEAEVAGRKGRNEAIFRAANEYREQRARAILRDDENAPVSFHCECANPECNEVVLLTLLEYEAVRSHSEHGLTLPGHEDPSVERVITRNERFVTVEKFGVAADVYADLDPRHEPDANPNAPKT